MDGRRSKPRSPGLTASVNRPRGIALLCCAWIAAVASVRAQQITLENSELRVTLSSGNGSVSSVVSKRHGPYLAPSEQAGWFRIRVPLPRWDGHTAGSASLRDLRVEQRGSDSVSFEAARLRSGEGAFAIRTRLSLRLERDNLVCRLALENRSRETVDRISFPILDLPPAADSKEALVMPRDLLVLEPAFSRNDVRTDHNPFDSLDPQGGWFLADPKISAKAFNYPDTLPSAWFTFVGESKGVGFDVRDRLFQFQKLIVERRLYRDARRRENNRRDYEVSWNWYPLVRPGASWESPEVYLKFGDGDWHGVARQHRDWLKGWIRRPVVAGKFQSSIGWVSRGVSSFDDIPAIARQGVEVGAPYFIVYHWSEAGPPGQIWGAYPRTDLGGVESLRRNLLKARELGAHPLAWFNPTLSGDATLDHLAQGKDWVVKNRWGAAIAGGQWTYGPTNLVWLEFDPNGTKHHLLDSIRRFVEDYRFSGFEFDQAYKFYLSYRDTDKVPPELAFSRGYGDFYPSAAELVKKHDPDGIIVAELYSDWLNQYADSSWVFDGGALNLDQLTRLRYSLPWITVPVRAVPQDKGHANHAFMLNAPLDIYDDLAGHPDYAKHLAKLHVLKQATTRYFFRGEFSDAEGFSLPAAGGVTARSYREPEGKFLAVVVVNPGATPRKAVMRSEAGFTPARVRRYQLNGRTETLEPSSEVPLELAPFDVQVVAFEKQ